MHILDQVEDSHSVSYGRKEVGAIGTVEQVALTVDSAQQVRELGRELTRSSIRSDVSQALPAQ